MKSTHLTVAFTVLSLVLLGSWSYGQEDLTALVNTDFETSFPNGGPVPGWTTLDILDKGETGPTYYNGPECPCLGGSENYRLKMEIGGFSIEQEWVVVKQVNWGDATMLNSVTIDVGSHSWGGSAGYAGFAGLGIDPDGGPVNASAWLNCSATDEYQGVPPPGDSCGVLSVSGVAKPGGATTFNIVLRTYRPPDVDWNSQWDNLFVSASDPNPPPQPSVTSQTHAESVWSNIDDVVVKFPTYNADEFYYEMDNSPTTDPSAGPYTVSSATFTDLANYDVAGDWYFHVKASNGYGTSPVDHFGPLKIDDEVPLVSNVIQTGNECEVTADCSDGGGSPFGAGNIAIYSRDDLLTNGGFESGNLSGWGIDGATPGVDTTVSIFTPSSGEPYEGTYMAYKTACCNAFTWEFTIYQELSVIPGRRYAARFRTCLGIHDVPGESSTLTADLQWVNGAWGGTPVTLASESAVDDEVIEWALVESTFIPTGSTATVAIHVVLTDPVEFAAVRLDAVTTRVYGGTASSFDGSTATWDAVSSSEGEVFTVIATDPAGNSASADSSAFSVCDPGFITGVGRPLWEDMR